MAEEQCVVAGVDVGGTTIKARAAAVDARAVAVDVPAIAHEARAAAADTPLVGAGAGTGSNLAEVAGAGAGAGGDGAGEVVPLGPADEVIRHPTPADDPEAALEAIAETVRTLAERVAPARLRAIGVVVPGIIDEPNGIAIFQAQLGWERLPVVARLGELTGLPVALGHDVRGGGLAEWQLGAGRGADDLLFVMLGTGIGSAAVVDGRLLTADGYAGQLGHIEVQSRTGAASDVDDLRCGCGQDGCLGTLASASAVVRRYAARSGNGGVVEAREVATLARAGDQPAIGVWNDAVQALAIGLADAITLFGSERIVLGGGLALAGEQLSVPVEEQVRRRLTFHRRPIVRTAELGDESAILGAALLAARTVS